VNLQRSAGGLEPWVVTSGQQPATGPTPEKPEMIAGTEYRRTPARQGRRMPFWREWELMTDLQRTIDAAVGDIAPDVIHAHSPVLVGLPALRVARQRGIPLVYEIRDLWENASIDRGKFSENSLSYRVARGVESYVLRRADRVVTICEGLRNALTSRVPDARKLHVVANGVDVEAFQPSRPEERVRERWDLAGKQVILYAGTFQPYEGLDLLIRAMPEVVRRAPHAHLVIVGGSPGLTGGSASLTVEERQLRAVVDECGVAARVTFTGRIPHGAVREMYAISDVLAYPRRWTRTTALTTPLKPLEGMAMGKPVIASDVPAMREIVADGRTGLLFKAGDHEDLAAKCCELLADPALMVRLGTAGRETACRERQWAHLVAQYLPIYKSIT
jgi:PEP-CTERM/exosortase A-associated glycosyltransferase